MEYPYNLPIWRQKYTLTSPDGKKIASVEHATEISMGNPTFGLLTITDGFHLELCSPAFAWSHDSRYLAGSRFTKKGSILRRQCVFLVDTSDFATYYSVDKGYNVQVEEFMGKTLVVTYEPFTRKTIKKYEIPDDLETQFRKTSTRDKRLF